jgi:MOSC domain-containing protein YiiM
MGIVYSVSKSNVHNFSKNICSSIKLIEGQGVEGDAHCGSTVKHRSRVKINPNQRNLRQVHLIHFELIEELREKGFRVNPATMGENITTKDIDLLSLPKNATLKIDGAEIEVIGLRNPCAQLDNYQKGLTTAVLDKDENGNLIRKAGIMGTVKKSGVIKVGDSIKVEFPPKPFLHLERV